MPDPSDPLSPRVVDFVHEHITSLLQLEALLLVFEAGGAGVSAERLSAQMYAPVAVLTQWLDGFVGAGLLDRGEDGYRLPESPEVFQLLSEVAECYVRRRISLSRVIFGAGRPERPDQRTRLSDAFRLRKDC